MNQEKITKAIKKNNGILRQFTSLNNEVKELKGRVLKLEKKEGEFLSAIKQYNRRGFEVVSGLGEMSKEEIANIKVRRTDPG